MFDHNQNKITDRYSENKPQYLRNPNKCSDSFANDTTVYYYLFKGLPSYVDCVDLPITLPFIDGQAGNCQIGSASHQAGGHADGQKHREPHTAQCDGDGFQFALEWGQLLVCLRGRLRGGAASSPSLPRETQGQLPMAGAKPFGEERLRRRRERIRGKCRASLFTKNKFN